MKKKELVKKLNEVAEKLDNCHKQGGVSILWEHQAEQRISDLGRQISNLKDKLRVVKAENEKFFGECNWGNYEGGRINDLLEYLGVKYREAYTTETKGKFLKIRKGK